MSHTYKQLFISVIMKPENNHKICSHWIGVLHFINKLSQQKLLVFHRSFNNQNTFLQHDHYVATVDGRKLKVINAGQDVQIKNKNKLFKQF